VGKVVVALELIATSKKPVRQQYFLRQYLEAKSSFCQATTHSTKISLIKSGLLLMFRVEWSRYVYWAHRESQGDAWIKVLSPMGRGSSVYLYKNKFQGPTTPGPTPVHTHFNYNWKMMKLSFQTRFLANVVLCYHVITACNYYCSILYMLTKNTKDSTLAIRQDNLILSY